MFIQLDTPTSESNADDIYQKKLTSAQQQQQVLKNNNPSFGQQQQPLNATVNQAMPLLNNDASKSKSSLAKRGSLALRQPPQERPLSDVLCSFEDQPFTSNENSNMIFNVNSNQMNPTDYNENQRQPMNKYLNFYN